MREQLSAFFALRHTNPALFWQRSLFWTFWFHMAFFAVGYGFREVMPILSLICLVMYYRYSWKESVLRTLPVKPLFASLWVMMFIGVAFSIDPWESFLEVGSSFNKGLILPFIAMECVKSLKDLKRLQIGQRRCLPHILLPRGTPRMRVDASLFPSRTQQGEKEHPET